MEASVADFTQVVFHDIEEFFNFSFPLVCQYTIGNGLVATSKDWIGLFKLGWMSVKEYISFEWIKVPEDYRDGKELNGSVTFKAEILPQDVNEFYQFCYVSSSGKVCGASPPFQFRDKTMNDFIEIDETPSMLLIQPRSADDFHFPSDNESKSFSSQSTDDRGLLCNSDELERVKKELSDLQSEVITLVADKVHVEQQLKQFNDAAANGDSQRQAAETELQEVSKLNTKLKEQLQCMKDDLKKVQDECSSMRDAHAEENRKHLQEIESLKQQLTKKSTELEVNMMNQARAMEEYERRSGETNESNEKLKKLVETYTVTRLEWEAKEEEYKREIAQLKDQTAHSQQMVHHANNAGSNDAVVNQQTDQASATRQHTPNPQSDVQGNVTNQSESVPRTCPACDLVFPPEIEEAAFNDHFTSMHMEKVCPVCDNHYPSDHSQAIFEAHVEICLRQSERGGGNV